MNNFIKILLATLLLGLGFFVGTSWKTGDTKTEPSSETTNVSTSQASPNQDLKTTAHTNPDLGRSDLNSAEKSTIKLFENAAPSVTFITTTSLKRDYFSMNVTEIPRGNGSGFVWDTEGHIITNFHVIQGADRAKVTLADRSTWPATVVGAAPDKDLAVLKIEAPKEILAPLAVGDSEDLLVGQSVYAIGNPFGLDQTLTTGIISALDREIESVSGLPIKGAIQTDAAINPGNSGGPLLDSSGRLIGVNTAIYSPSGAYAGIGFSIPVDVVKWVVPDLLKYGRLQRPTLGISTANNRLAGRLGIDGILILGVTEGGPAEQAGMQATYRDRTGNIVMGDIITKINDDKISNRNDLLLTLEKYKVGEQIEVTVLRNEAEEKVRLTLGAAQ